MLTAPVTFLMPDKGPAQRAEAFEEICKHFSEDISHNPFPYPKIAQQSCISEEIRKLAPLSQMGIIEATTMEQWLRILSRFNTGNILGNLLKKTAPLVVTNVPFNFGISNIILNQLTLLLERQVLHQKLYSAEDPTLFLKDVVPALHELIMQIIRNKSSLNPAQISTILKTIGSSAFILNGEEADEVFSALIEQINCNGSQKHNFSDNEVQNAFWGLRHSHEKNSFALENLLQVLLFSLQYAKMNVNSRISQLWSHVIYSLKNSPGNIATMAILKQATNQLNIHTAVQQWISSDTITRMIAGLASMGKNTEVEALLTALQPHLQQLNLRPSRTNIQLFSLKQVGMILDGLQHFADSQFALDILQELTTQFAPPSFWELHAIDLKKWLANAIYSLSSYLNETASSAVREQAMRFLNTAVDTLKLRPKLKENDLEFTVEDLSYQEEREFLIMQIGQFTDHYWAISVDLSGYACSRALVSFIAQYIRQMELNGEVEVPETPRPVYFSYTDDNIVEECWYEPEEIEWMRKIIFEKVFPQNVPHEPNGLSRSSGTSSTSHTNYIEEEYDREDVASAAAAP